MDIRIMEPDAASPTSLKQKLRSSLCIIPCFPNSKHHDQHHPIDTSPSPSTPHGGGGENYSLLRATTASLSTPKSARAHHRHHEFAGKCRNLIGRMGRHGRRHSADFKYDPLSYALNFDHEETNAEDESYPFRNSNARFPPSPPAAASPSSKEMIYACS